MDLPIYLPTKKVFVQTFFLEKVWLEDTLPTYNLDICPKFRSFFLLDPLLSSSILETAVANICGAMLDRLFPVMFNFLILLSS